MRVILIYDCPKVSCTKMWVLKELEKNGYCVKVIYSRYPISNIEQKGKLGKLIARLLVLWQAIKGTIVSNKGDIVFCWNNFNALYFNFITGGNRKIISYNWLTPTPRKETLFLYQKALNNKNLMAVINYEGNKNLLLESYHVEDHHNIHYIPDVYDDSVSFKKPVYRLEDKYIFSGGRANRDWELFLEIAKECPTIRFVGVAAASDWDKSLVISSNVTMFYDLSASEYYEILDKSYMTIYPLKEDRVSGLVNVIKSIQSGKLVACTNTLIIKEYLPENKRYFIIDKNRLDMWVEIINKCISLKEHEYTMTVNELQIYLKQVYSPQRAGIKIDEIISRYLQENIITKY